MSTKRIVFSACFFLLFLSTFAMAQGWWGAIQQPFPEQTDAFTLEFDVVPRDSSVFRTHITVSQEIPGLIGLDNAWHENAIIIRFKPDDRMVDGRNGSTYESIEEFTYFGGESYHIRMEIDVLSQSYSLYINSLPDGDEWLIAEDYGFRTEAVDNALGNSLGYLNVMVPYRDLEQEKTDTGSDLMNMQIKDLDGAVVWSDEELVYDPAKPVFPPVFHGGPFPLGSEETRDDAPVDITDPTDVVHEYTAYKGTPVIDGKADDEVWQRIPWTLMEYNTDIVDGTAGSLWDAESIPPSWLGWDDLATYFKVAHDDDYIYLTVARYDDDYSFVFETTENDGNIWQNDAYQMIVDTRYPYEYDEEMPGAEIGLCQVDELEVYHFWSTSNQNPAVQLELAEGDNASGVTSTDGKAIHGTIEYTDLGYFEVMEAAFVKYDDMVDDMITMFSVCALDRDFDMHESVNQWARGIWAKDPEMYGSIWWHPETAPVTGVNDRVVTNSPTTFSLLQNYPNPFNPVTKIEYRLPRAGNVTLHVFNLSGKKVRTLVQNEWQPAGEYNVTFDAGDLASGVYFYQLETAGETVTKKMTLVR